MNDRWGWLMAADVETWTEVMAWTIVRSAFAEEQHVFVAIPGEMIK